MNREMPAEVLIALGSIKWNVEASKTVFYDLPKLNKTEWIRNETFVPGVSFELSDTAPTALVPGYSLIQFDSGIDLKHGNELFDRTTVGFRNDTSDGSIEMRMSITFGHADAIAFTYSLQSSGMDGISQGGYEVHIDLHPGGSPVVYETGPTGQSQRYGKRGGKPKDDLNQFGEDIAKGIRTILSTVTAKNAKDIFIGYIQDSNSRDAMNGDHAGDQLDFFTLRVPEYAQEVERKDEEILIPVDTEDHIGDLLNAAVKKNVPAIEVRSNAAEIALLYGPIDRIQFLVPRSNPDDMSHGRVVLGLPYGRQQFDDSLNKIFTLFSIPYEWVQFETALEDPDKTLFSTVDFVVIREDVVYGAASEKHGAILIAVPKEGSLGNVTSWWQYIDARRMGELGL